MDPLRHHARKSPKNPSKYRIMPSEAQQAAKGDKRKQRMDQRRANGEWLNGGPLILKPGQTESQLLVSFQLNLLLNSKITFPRFLETTRS